LIKFIPKPFLPPGPPSGFPEGFPSAGKAFILSLQAVSPYVKIQARQARMPPYSAGETRKKQNIVREFIIAQNPGESQAAFP
jgi:hypothetical protein